MQGYQPDWRLLLNSLFIDTTNLAFVIYIHTYHSRFIPEGVADAAHIFLQDAHVLPKLFSYE
jgi:hypothetical protein